MPAFFQELLQENSDAWNQTQKEAMIDLCLLGMYLDDLISLAEQDFMETEFMHLKWNSETAFSIYLQRAISKIRLVKADPQKAQDFLQNISERLESNELKIVASSELEKLLAADGVVKLEEDFLAEVKKVMGL